MTKNVFEIKNLVCSYKHNLKPVLEIENLAISKGKVVTILGKSGSGKSTLIETLGMMNNTISEGRILFNGNDKEYLINQQLWKTPSALSAIRSSYFSFIFQNDYLMPYYTPTQNMLIGKLIQNYQTKLSVNGEDVLGTIGILAKKLELDLSNKQMPYEMSGGQKQRLSFIRAISKNYSVIFGDEPTGNLDDDTSEKLMKVLRESVTSDPKRTAVLVSHNINLSLNYSDKIIILTPGKHNSYTITNENVFSGSDDLWTSLTGKTLNKEKLIGHIRKLIGHGAENKQE